MTVVTERSKPDGVAGRDFISWSQLSTYRQCPLRHHFRYVQRLPEEFVSASLLFGGAFHGAVEDFHRRQLEGLDPPSLDEMLAAFWDEWNHRAESANDIRFNKADDINTMGQLADRMLHAFVDSSVSKPDGAVIGIEEQFRDPVIPGCPDLLAYVDLVIDRGDELVLRDYKTSRSRWSQRTADGSAEQLLLYSELVRRLAPGKTLRLEFAVVSKAKTPSVELYDIGADPKRVARTKRIAQRTYRAIQNGDVYPNPSPMNCSGCPFQKACASWSGE